MSNIHLGLPYPGGVVDHSSNLANDIGVLYLNDEYSDVTLQVNGQAFHAHKVILAARSQYFRALLFGGLRESHQAVVEIKDTNLTAFKVLLRYIYTGWVSLGSEKEETVLEILGLAHQYGFEDLEAAICDYLKDALCIPNVCVIYDMATLYSLCNLKAVCEDFMDKNALPILNHESFYSLSPSALKAIISRDSFCAPEVHIFQGVYEWVERSTDLSPEQTQEILSQIRLPLISLSDLLNVVRPTGLISPDQILDAIKAKNESRDMDLQYRGYLMPGENVAVQSKGAQVLQGEMRANLLDGNVSTYDMDRGFTRHPIDDNNGQGILVKLGMQCIINHMRMMLWDKDQRRGYSYYIEVSMDQKDWVRVVDHTRYHCRSWQYLYFPARVVRYIRIVGTNNTVNRVFHVVAFEAYYSKQEVELHKGLIIPRENVALVTKSALVLEGVSRSRNNLLNGDIHHYDWDSGYTCHQLGSGSICVQLGQAYWLSSCKLLLWDCDDRSYSYYIEASVNNRDWELIVDKTREACRSWQTLTFAPRAIVYFKIVGTFNTANEVFHCVHFEAPAQVGSENRPRVKGFDHAVAPVRPHPSGGSIEDGRGSPAGAEAVVVDSNLVALEAGPVRERLGSTARSDHSEESRMREEGAVVRVREEGAVGRVCEEGSMGRVREDVGVGARRREERDVRTRAREENRAGRRREDIGAGERAKEQCPRPQTPLPEVVVVPEPKARHPRHHCLQDDSDDDEEEESKDK
ncbi:BTB/POZ domain-containing protein 9-like isoform X1 [Scylla paramamosain]|uniref:BTB/POZ domain-containing protein 9-like isoform X1 n=1 Tax=Scylla paramamosain TaxID=85552 RepID=UPI0030838F1C